MGVRGLSRFLKSLGNFNYRVRWLCDGDLDTVHLLLDAPGFFYFLADHFGGGSSADENEEPVFQFGGEMRTQLHWIRRGLDLLEQAVQPKKMKLTAVFEIPEDSEKSETLATRRQQLLEMWADGFETMQGGRANKKGVLMADALVAMEIRRRQHTVFFCVGEADHAVIQLARQLTGPVIVLTNDSDLLGFPLKKKTVDVGFFDELDLATGKFMAYTADEVSHALQLPAVGLPLLFSLLGNDYTKPVVATDPFQRALKSLLPRTVRGHHFMRTSAFVRSYVHADGRVDVDRCLQRLQEAGVAPAARATLRLGCAFYAIQTKPLIPSANLAPSAFVTFLVTGALLRFTASMPVLAEDPRLRDGGVWDATKPMRQKFYHYVGLALRERLADQYFETSRPLDQPVEEIEYSLQSQPRSTMIPCLAAVTTTTPSDSGSGQRPSLKQMFSDLAETTAWPELKPFANLYGLAVCLALLCTNQKYCADKDNDDVARPTTPFHLALFSLCQCVQTGGEQKSSTKSTGCSGALALAVNRCFLYYQVCLACVHQMLETVCLLPAKQLIKSWDHAFPNGSEVAALAASTAALTDIQFTNTFSPDQLSTLCGLHLNQRPAPKEVVDDWEDF